MIKRLLGAGLPSFPNLRVLSGYRLLDKVGDTTRGGKPLTWWMPDGVGVDKALDELAQPSGLRWGSNAVAYAHGFRASHNPFDVTTPSGRIEWHVYRERGNELVEMGFAPNVLAAREACRKVVEAAFG